jgi:uncharacterized protein involved in exopolysaccharide biosynthesis
MTEENNIITERNIDDEITLKELYLKISSMVRFLLSKWLILFMAGIIGGGIGLLIAIYTKPIYTGTLTFVLSTDSKGGGLSGLASQFGFDMGSSGGTDVFSGDNILTLFKSERMLKLVLFKKPPTQNDILANIIVKEWEWDKKWKKKKRTNNQFPFPEDTSKLTPVQDSLLREVYMRISEKDLSVNRIDKKLSVYEVSTKTTNEIFACYLTRYLMDETADFYIETKTSLAKLNLKMIKRVADSLRGLLGGAISSTARETDRTFALNPALQAQRVPAQKGQVQATVLAAAYGEVLKNLEIAKITLQKEKPLYQIIDVPEIPLKKQNKSKLLFLISGGFIGIIGCGLFLIIRKKYIIFRTGTQQ